MEIMTAPMAGITDYSFRRILNEFSPDVIFTEMADVSAVVNKNKKTIDEILKAENNESVQLFGSKTDNFKEAVKILLEMGFTHIDINLGCPMKKIIKSGKGAALLEEPEYIRKLLTEIKKEYKDDIALSIKIRVGYKDFNDPFYYVRLAEELRLKQICIHGRTQKQGYQGDADWEIIKKIKENSNNIKIIGNGDLFNIEDIINKTRESKVDGIMLARGILGNPWLIKQAKDYFNNENMKKYDVSKREKRNLLIKHINYYIIDKGENRAFLNIKKHIFWYLSDFYNIKIIKKEISNLGNIKEILSYIEKNIEDR